MPANSYGHTDPDTGLVTRLKTAHEMIAEEVANVEAGRYYIPQLPTYERADLRSDYYEPPPARPSAFEPPPLGHQPLR